MYIFWESDIATDFVMTTSHFNKFAVCVFVKKIIFFLPEMN